VKGAGSVKGNKKAKAPGRETGDPKERKDGCERKDPEKGLKGGSRIDAPRLKRSRCTKLRIALWELMVKSLRHTVMRKHLDLVAGPSSRAKGRRKCS